MFREIQGRLLSQVIKFSVLLLTVVGQRSWAQSNISNTSANNEVIPNQNKAGSQDTLIVDKSLIKYATGDIIGDKTGKLERRLDASADKAITRLKKQEDKMRRKLAKIDSLAANNIFSNAEKKYKQLEQRLISGNVGQYLPKLDTLGSSLKFLQQRPQLLSEVKNAKEKLDANLDKLGNLKEKFNNAEEIRKFLRERKQYLKEQLSKFGFAKELKKINKEVYYYSQQLSEVKEALKDSKKTEKKAIELLSKTKMFKDFMRKNSELASLFRMPGDPNNNPSSQVSLIGLQTRAQLNNLIQQQLSAGGSMAMRQFKQNMKQVQTQMHELKDKVLGQGGSSSDDLIPEGFKPNNQKSKSFFKRLEYGVNTQTQKANSIFPVTSDIAVSVGYKLNNNSVVGISSSIKMGWGTGWRDIRIHSQGVGLRSYVDYKIKGSFWLSGGFEMNFRNEIRQFDVLRDQSAWQKSGLIGLSKKHKIKKRQASIQILWDFLSYKQIPRPQPIVIRYGFSLSK